MKYVSMAWCFYVFSASLVSLSPDNRMIKVNGTREPLEFKSHQWFGASVRSHKGKVVVSVSQSVSLRCLNLHPQHKLENDFEHKHFSPFKDILVDGNIMCCAGMRSSLPLADGEDQRGAGPRGDLLCGRPKLQRLRRVFTLQDQ